MQLALMSLLHNNNLLDIFSQYRLYHEDKTFQLHNSDQVYQVQLLNISYQECTESLKLLPVGSNNLLNTYLHSY